ncbi:DISARM system helicase DrmA [Roseateles oligotrophus]|uniref:DISARM system helicase DrmA n=1 Tax=Roseateles oligotrophus TaxID=1769250 RepID=A0ABT2YIY3_9BURK|nr:DISARM system helicase DrmA [Roseateles oligotrophus]MCV2370026.1 DISARM system helicase DrmA [Roseateles oligotrophus]
MTTNPNAWVAIDHGLAGDHALAPYTLRLQGDRSLYLAIANDDWVLVISPGAQITRVGRVIRIRSDLTTTTLYFDRLLQLAAPVSAGVTSLVLPQSGPVGRIQWSDFLETLDRHLLTPIGQIPLIGSKSDQHELAYIRELLQLAVTDDLLGPAGGPHERIVDMGVRDRYLVGKLAPREVAERGQESPVDAETAEDEEADLVVKAAAGTMDSPSVKARPDKEGPDEVDAASNQSLVPSSLGFTFCVAGDVAEIELEARWGRYERRDDHDFVKVRKNKDTGAEVEVKAKVWQRVPCGGKITLDLLSEGPVGLVAPDVDNPEVMVQGSIRAKNSNGDRLITLFLVNAQSEPDSNRDSAWLFQPELIVRAPAGAADPAIFRRRPVQDANAFDPEREALEMIYRNRVEFAVGHGVAVGATEADDIMRATEVRTTVMPQYEVQVTETPGLDPTDRPAMRVMVDSGLLDMERLAKLDVADLVQALGMLTDDYAAWIAEQRARVGVEVLGHDAQAKLAMERCDQILLRLREGIATLGTDPKALAAFRFANQAMATQRVRSLYALAVRRKEDVTVDQFNLLKNRSWRPFQLAFVLLSIPALANPMHDDRVQAIEAYADLLWFPTGGGKTEAYLGVAAFTMAIRRLQGNLGGYDSSRGLSVIMRYTLRLLTLQQFQRATALICAMEVLRRVAIAAGDQSLGAEPFTIGLWVGNKVTPGTTEESHEVIENIRNPAKYHAGAASPAQLTSCPWCGTEIEPGKDVEVSKIHGRTFLYCGDKKGRCDFSRGKSSTQAHPGLPVLVVDEEIYHRPPTMMIATVDKFAMMAWRGQVRTLFGRAGQECERHGLLWKGCGCTGNHPKDKVGPASKVKPIAHQIRPPDLIIQDEFHLISGPLGTMVGLYETTVDKLCSWDLNGKTVKPKIIASTATVRKATEQVKGVFMRQVSVFPPHGLDVEDNYFSVQRPIKARPGRRYLGVCSPGSSRPAMLIRVYTAFLTAGQGLFDRFGAAADPYMTMVGYFNSLRELGGMKRLAEDDVQTRAYRVKMSMVERPALAQRSVNNIRELTSRVSSQDIPKYLDQMEVKFKAEYDSASEKYVTRWKDGDTRAIDVVLATNMLSVGVDVNRLGLMAVNGQPKGTAEYIQATSRVGRAFPGLVCTVLTWARPRDLSHYETFEHYHATFYKHVEAQSVTPFSPRAMDRGLTGAMLSLMRLDNDVLSPNDGAGELTQPTQSEMTEATSVLVNRAWSVTDLPTTQALAQQELKARADEWAKEANVGGRILAYEKKGADKDMTAALIKSPGIHAWDHWTVPMSMREVEPGVRLIMNTSRLDDDQAWVAQQISEGDD